MEEANAATFFSEGSTYTYQTGDWRHRFALDISTWTEPFPIYAFPTEGVGNPPDSMIVDGQGRVLSYWATRYPMLGPLGNTFGTAYSVDIAFIDQADGTRQVLSLGAAPSWSQWETDNLYALSASGTNELWLKSRWCTTK